MAKVLKSIAFLMAGGALLAAGSCSLADLSSLLPQLLKGTAS